MERQVETYLFGREHQNCRRKGRAIQKAVWLKFGKRGGGNYSAQSRFKEIVGQIDANIIRGKLDAKIHV